MAGVLVKRGNLDTKTQMQERQYEDTREGGHLPTKDNGLEQTLPSQPEEGTNPSDTRFGTSSLQDREILNVHYVSRHSVALR